MAIRIRRLGKKNAKKLREIYDTGYGHNVRAALEFLSKIYKVSVPKFEVGKPHLCKGCWAKYDAPGRITFRLKNPALRSVLHEFCHHVQYSRAKRIVDDFTEANMLAFADLYENLPHKKRRHEVRAFKFTADILELGK